MTQPPSSFDYWKDAGSDPGDIEFAEKTEHLPIASLAPAAALQEYTDADYYKPTGFGEIGNFMRNKRRKLGVQLDDLRAHDPDAASRPQIFKGLAIYINGLVLDGQGALQQLIKLLKLHGGEYVSYLDKKSLVTHIVAATLTPSKRVEFRSYKVAKPAWLFESVAAGRLLPWNNYLESSATYQESAARIGDGDAPAGMQTTQRSLMSMGAWKEKTVPSDSKGKEGEVNAGVLKTGKEREVILETEEDIEEVVVKRVGKGKQREVETVEEEESLEERGRRLGALATSAHSHHTLFDVGPSKPTTSKTTSTAASLDLIAKNQARYDSYLPSAASRSRACLQDPEWLAEHTSKNPNYIANYFANSRLHYLSTWKAELVLLCSDLQEGHRPPIRNGKAKGDKTIFHVDFDCFFVSVGLISRPHLRGKPVAVCHAKTEGGDPNASTSEISSCSYEARLSGVRSVMSLGRAREICPDLQAIPFEFDNYQSTAIKFYNILLQHSDFLQAVSVDEVLMDVSSKFSSPAQILAFAHQLRSEIFDATGCPASIGIGHNVLLAKVATKKAKPNNAFYLPSSLAVDHLAPLDVQELPGIGGSLAEKLETELGATKVGDLLKHSESELCRVLGKENGKKFLGYAKGIDPRVLEVGKGRQSVSVEVNYGIRFEEGSEGDRQNERFVKQIGVELAKRLSEISMKARLLTLKLKIRHPESPIEAPKFLGHGHVTEQSKSLNLREGATDDATILGEAAWKLMQELRIPVEELRGIAVQAQKLEKDGIPVGSVRDSGQGALGFKALPPPIVKPTTRTKRSSDSISLVDTPPIASTSKIPCISLLDDSDGELDYLDVKPAVVPLERTRSRSAAAKGKPEKVKKLREAIIFKQTKKEAAKQLRLQQRRLETDIGQQLGSQIVKPTTVSKPKPKARAEPVLVIPVPSPTTLTDQEIVAMKKGFDPTTFRELPLDMQREEIKIIFARKRALAIASVQPQINAPTTVRSIKLKVVAAATCNKKTDINDLRDMMEQWIVVHREEAPHEADVRVWVRFLLECCDESKGQDLVKVTALLSWWEVMLEQVHGREIGKKGVGEEWWDVFRRVRNDFDGRKFAGASLSF